MEEGMAPSLARHSLAPQQGGVPIIRTTPYGTPISHPTISSNPDFSLPPLSGREGFKQKPRYCPPSSRELEVLQLLTDGNSNKEIAILLGISHNTVKNHIYSLSKKLDVSGQIELVNFGLRNGYCTLNEDEVPHTSYQRGRIDELTVIIKDCQQRRSQLCSTK